MNNLVLNSQEMAYLYDKYAYIARSAFGYLNGRVNRYNICTLRLDYFSSTNYAEFRKPNVISIKLGSIIDSVTSMNKSEGFIRGLIVLSIAHELSHADQAASMTRYGFDPVYMQYMEDSAEYVSQRFLLSNMKQIDEMFNTSIKSVVSVYGRTYPSNLQPRAFDLLDHYATSIVDVLLRDYSMQKKVYDFFVIDNVDIDFDGYTVKVKRNGEFISDITLFNSILNQYREVAMNSQFVVKMKFKLMKSNKARAKITTSNVRYMPIISFGNQDGLNN